MRDKSRNHRLRFALLLCVLLIGYLLGMRLPEERRNRMRKLLFEAKEMPFRVFV